jgi:hypothetical protein
VNELELIHLIQAHTFAKLSKQGAALQLTAMDFEWLAKTLKNNPKPIPHVSRKDYAILTASTEELQKFVAAHADNTNAFKNAITLLPKK